MCFPFSVCQTKLVAVACEIILCGIGRTWQSGCMSHYDMQLHKSSITLIMKQMKPVVELQAQHALIVLWCTIFSRLSIKIKVHMTGFHVFLLFSFSVISVVSIIIIIIIIILYKIRGTGHSLIGTVWLHNDLECVCFIMAYSVPNFNEAVKPVNIKCFFFFF